jgi:predicted enzyme related to lactoylglutathione lyase
VRFDENEQRPGYTLWSPFAADTDYFGPGTQPYMVNFRVDDLDALLAQLRAAGVEVDERVDQSEFGRFGWITDPEGTRIELWQPPA